MRRLHIFALTCSIVFHGVLAANQYIPEWRKNIPYTHKNDEKKSVYYGPTNLSNRKSENLTIYGPAELNQMDISNKTLIKGPVEAKHSLFHDVQIDGIANFDNVKVAKITIHGPLYASNSQLTEASVTSTEAAFSQAKIGKLIMKKEHNDERQQRVYLEKGSKIDSLVFESPHGRVILVDSNSTVTNLQGGEIEPQK